MKRWLLFLGSLAIFLGGCTIPPPQPDQTPLAFDVTVSAIDGLTVTFRVEASGGTPPYYVNVSLPDLVLAPTGSIAGTFVYKFAHYGTWKVVFTLGDSGGATVTKILEVELVEPPVKQYTVTVEFGNGGVIIPSVPRTVDEGTELQYVVKAFPGYVIGDVLLDGDSVYSPENEEDKTLWVFSLVVTKDHHIWAGFGQDQPPPPPL